MLKSKHIDRLCLAVIGVAVLVTLAFMNGERFGLAPASAEPVYATRLFDASRVHTIDIEIDDWQAFLAAAPKEQYWSADLVIDGERIDNVGLRAKGNNSLRLTEDYGHERYSLKVEFDHFAAQNYHGLDKLSLDASFQDNTYMKNWIAFDMMRFMDVPTPLASYSWVTVNGEPGDFFSPSRSLRRPSRAASTVVITASSTSRITNACPTTTPTSICATQATTLRGMRIFSATPSST